MELDIYLFELINTKSSNQVFDLILPWVRNKLVWIPMYVFLIAFVLFNYGKRAIPFLFFLFITVGLTDSVSSHIIKKTVERKRPCQQPSNFDTITVRINCGSGFSFPSSHAANHFSVAFFIFLFTPRVLKKWSFAFLFWAAAISFSQVYVGVHYPFDITMGALLGIAISSVVFVIAKFGFYKNQALL